MNKPMDLLRAEQAINPWVHGILLAVLLTGLVLLASEPPALLGQFALLAHVFVGLVYLALVIPYLVVHFCRTLALRRATMIISGLTILLTMCLGLASGTYMAIVGQSERLAWLPRAHLWLAFALVVFVMLHLILHVWLFPKHRKLSGRARFVSLRPGFGQRVMAGNAVIVCLVLLGYFIYLSGHQPGSPQPMVKDYAYSYSEHPFRPSQTETYSGGFVRMQEIADSQKCLICHQEIGEQWLSSMHRWAAADPSYVTNIILLAKNKGIEATRYCEGCHAPVALLTGMLSPGGEHGGVAGSVGFVNGVNCMGCHGIHSLVHLKGVASYQFKPASGYLFQLAEDGIRAWLNQYLINLSPNLHKRDMMAPVLTEPKMCAACHSQFMDKDMNDWGWVQMQDDYRAWLKSQYSGQHQPTFASASRLACRDCHMPLIKADDPSADNQGLVRSHHFTAANSFVPLLSGDQAQFERVKRFLQANRLRITIDKPYRSDLPQSQQFVDESLREPSEGQMLLYLGEQLKVQVAVSNIGVGHDFPGGTIDINQAWIEFVVTDAQGQQVFASGIVDDEGELPPTTHQYHSLPVDRKGQLVWRHDLFNMVGESFRRVIPAGGADIAEYTFSVPAWVKSPLVVTATVKYRKLNTRYAKWALKEHYIVIPAIEMAWDSISIPVKVQKAVKKTGNYTTAIDAQSQQPPSG